MYSLSQIAKEIGISKTMVYNIVQDWNLKVSMLDLDDIRIFLSHLRKADITIGQCIQGYRTTYLLKQMSVDDDEFDDWLSDDEGMQDDLISENHAVGTRHIKAKSIDSELPYLESSSDKSPKENNISLKSTYQFDYFVKHIYNNCKNHKIKPSIIVRWIDDLFSFYSYSDGDSIDDTIFRFSTNDQKNTKAEVSPASWQIEKYDSEIPFISNVSNFIKAKKKRINYLQNRKNLIANEIAILEKEKTESVFKLDKAIEKEKKAYSYFDWYNNLSQYLFNRYGILLEQDIYLFAKALQDFKQFNFSVTKILSEYRIIDSLRNETKQIKDELHLYTLKRDKLREEINSLEDRSNYFQQTLKIYEELDKEGLGLKELKRLNYFVMESAFANGLEVRGAIKNFLKDLEDNYDNKLGFEKKIIELKAEMKKLEQEVPEYQYYLKLQGIVSPTLIHLQSSGVTNEDIIGMNHLVLEFKNGNFLSDPINKNYVNPISNTDNNNNNVVRTHTWILFVEKLKELKNINMQIQKQSEHLNSLKGQVCDLEENRQKIDKAYVESVTILNHVLTKLDQYIGLNKRINEKTNNKTIVPIPVIFPVFIKYHSVEKKKDNDQNSNQ